MRLEYDPIGDIAYITVRDGEVCRTEDVSDGRQYDRGIDFDADGQIVGYEFMNTSRGLTLESLPHREEIAAFLASVSGLRVIQKAS